MPTERQTKLLRAIYRLVGDEDRNAAHDQIKRFLDPEDLPMFDTDLVMLENNGLIGRGGNNVNLTPEGRVLGSRSLRGGETPELTEGWNRVLLALHDAAKEQSRGEPAEAVVNVDSIFQHSGPLKPVFGRILGDLVDCGFILQRQHADQFSLTHRGLSVASALRR